MSKLALLSLLGLALGATVLEGREILLENGKTLYLRTVDSSELSYIESIVGCSTKCASACLSFSTGQASVQCAKHCGCSSLISSKPALPTTQLYDPDVSIDVYYPSSSTGSTEIFADVQDEDVRVSVTQSTDEFGSYTQAAVNTENGDPTADEAVVTEYVYVDSTSQQVGVSVDASTGEYASATAYNYNSGVDGNGTFSTYQYVGVTTVDSYGNTNTDYVDSVQVGVTDGNSTVIVKNNTASIDNIYAEEYEVIVMETNQADGSTEGYTVRTFNWVNVQEIYNTFTSLAGLITILVASCILYLVYKKVSTEATKRYNLNITPVEHSVDYIRI